MPNASRTLNFTGDMLESVETPAFIYDESEIQWLLNNADRVKRNSPCKVLFPLKPFSFFDVLQLMARRLDGFAVSSLFESRLAHQTMSGHQSVHLTSPGLRPQDVDEIGTLCDFVAFNSLNQWDQHHQSLERRVSCGLRVNPQLSFVPDQRYDPCRPHSKLGIPLADLAKVATHSPQRITGLEGLHFHSNCESKELDQLHGTVMRLHDEISELLHRVQWVNLGGGYFFEDNRGINRLCETVKFLSSTYGVQVFIEPGAAFIQSAGYIVSTVLDIFQHTGKHIVVLDTTVNHMPEVFEYGYEPDLVGHVDNAPLEYLLVGCTCLAGDLFGEYSFDQPIKVGDRVVFRNVGAYTLTKAHTFNGVNLPDIYALDETGALTLKKRFSYSDFADKWGAHVAISE